MKILFSPSESKSDILGISSVNDKSFFFSNLFEKRIYVIEKFLDFLHKTDDTGLSKVFGIKKINECQRLANLDLLNSFTCKAIKRYTGVAYEYLNYDNLPLKTQKWLCNNVIIFSNLWGPILAGDEIPFYKYKQGQSFDDFKTETFYKEFFSQSLDNFLNEELVIDLRAGFYEKFYKINKPYISAKFIKNGKVISHWAKAYRGIMLRQLALEQPSSINEFEKIIFPNLSITDCIAEKWKKEYIFEIKV